MIKNEYYIENNVAYFTITRRSGEKVIVKMDEEDLSIIDKLNIKMSVGWYKKIDGYYACFTQYLGIINGKAKYKTLLLQRIVTNTYDKRQVDHENHDTVDNRKENLRVVERPNNVKNRKTKNSNNKSGYRNVCEINNEWVVQL